MSRKSRKRNKILRQQKKNLQGLEKNNKSIDRVIKGGDVGEINLWVDRIIDGLADKIEKGEWGLIRQSCGVLNSLSQRL